MTIDESIFLKPAVQRPSHTSQFSSNGDSQPAIERFAREKAVLEKQLSECQALYATLLDVRQRKKNGTHELTQNTEVAQGVYFKTEIHNTDSFIVSLGLQDAYVELELEEAIAYCQRREEYLRVALKRLDDRLSGLQAELQMDVASLSDLLTQARAG